MGRHSMNYHPDQGDTAVPAAAYSVFGDASIAPPGGPVDPGTPGFPDAPGAPEYPSGPSFPGDPTPDAPQPDPGTPQPEPGSPEITPSEPPPFAPDEASDGAVPVGGPWHAAGEAL